MAVTGTINLILQVNGQPLALPISIPALTSTDAIGQVLGPYTLQGTDNTINFPTGKTTTGVLILWPSGNATAVGIGASAAVHAAPTGFYLHTPRSTDTSMIINAAAQITGVYIVFI